MYDDLVNVHKGEHDDVEHCLHVVVDVHLLHVDEHCLQVDVHCLQDDDSEDVHLDLSVNVWHESSQLQESLQPELWL